MISVQFHLEDAPPGVANPLGIWVCNTLPRVDDEVMLRYFGANEFNNPLYEFTVTKVIWKDSTNVICKVED